MSNSTLALVLSGGGLRATVFHLGVLMRLAAEHRLEDVVALSTVSGGSLAAALVFSRNGLEWPSSEIYLKNVLPGARSLLTETSLQGHAVRMALMRPWRLVMSRGNLLAKALASEWGITGSMKQLPERPWWLINATTYETGRNWRFSRHHIGDWKIGHNYAQDVPICLAVAASAAIPYMAGFVKLDLTPDGWFQIDPATEKPVHEKKTPCKAVRLWDGGVYENLGIEGVWKPSGFVEAAIGFMIVSDASAYLNEELGPATGIFTTRPPFLRPPRLFDITTEQTRALRSRMLMSAVTGDRKLPAAIVRLGRSVEYIDKQANRSRGMLAADTFLNSSAVLRAGRYPTNASRMSDRDFELLLRHGFESADATLTGHASAVFLNSFTWDAVHLELVGTAAYSAAST